jgi:hypothetical protein
MSSYSNYFRQRLNAQDERMKQINTYKYNNITGKKRKYKEALGYSNDYVIVQDSQQYLTLATQNRGANWIDAYLEHL